MTNKNQCLVLILVLALLACSSPEPIEPIEPTVTPVPTMTPTPKESHVAALTESKNCEISAGVSNELTEKEPDIGVGKLFFQVDLGLGDEDRGELWSMDPYGENIRNLTRVDGIHSTGIQRMDDISFSKDGTRIASSYDDREIMPGGFIKYTTIDLRDADGRNPDKHVITQQGNDLSNYFVDNQFEWSINGDFLYNLLHDDDESNLVSIDTKSWKIDAIPEFKSITSFKFSPNQDLIAITSNQGLVIYDFVNRTQVSSIPHTGSYGQLKWSPNNNNILFSLSNDAYIMDTKTGCYKNLTAAISKHPSGEYFGWRSSYSSSISDREVNYFWSPNGKIIHLSSLMSEQGIYLLEVNSWNFTHLGNISPSKKYDPWVFNVSWRDYLEWSKDGRKFFYQERVENESSIKTYDLQTGLVTQLTPAGDRAEGFALSPDGTQIAFYSIIDKSTKIYIFDKSIKLMNTDGTNLSTLMNISDFDDVLDIDYGSLEWVP